MKSVTMIVAVGAVSAMAGCGGGGPSGQSGTGGGGQPTAGYLPLSNTSAATSELAGAILADSGRTVSLTSGTLSHASQSFTAVGVTGNRSLATAGNFATPTTNYN